MLRRWITLAAVAVSLLPFSSCTCGSSAPEPPPKMADRRTGFGAVATPRKIPERVEAQVTPRNPELQLTPNLPTPRATPNQAAVPDNFPEGVPIPEGSHVMAVQSLANDAHNVIFATDGDTPQLFDLYKDSMKGNGWGNPTQEYQGREQSFLSFKKGNTITNISVSKDPKSGQRIIAVMYYEEKPLPFPEF